MEILEFCADKLRSRGLGSGAGRFQLREVEEGRVENLNKSTLFSEIPVGGGRA
ncbi:MAG: hypothetical protein HYW49_13025 [Deltaproteobacteria bacterium]|nr:hypothetical protein [Deltaproteobacteria bacterium]